MKSRVISQTNREVIAVTLSVIALKDEFARIRSLLLQTSDLLLPFHTRAIAELECASTLMRLLAPVRDKETDLSKEDSRHDMRHVTKKIFNASHVPTYTMLDTVTATLDLGNVRDQTYPLFYWDSPFSYHDVVTDDYPQWVADAYGKDNQRYRQMWQLKDMQMLHTKMVGNYYNTTLTFETCEEIRPAIEKLIEANQAGCKLVTTFEALRRDIENNIEAAKTTKALMEAWPESRQVLERLYGSTADAVEVPLGNIVLRHVSQLPAPSSTLIQSDAQ